MKISFRYQFIGFVFEFQVLKLCGLCTQAVKNDAKAVFAIFNCLMLGHASANGIGIVAAPKAPQGVAQYVHVDIGTNVTLALCIGEHLSDGVHPPLVVALRTGVVFKNVLVELLFEVVGTNQRIGNHIGHTLKKFLLGVAFPGYVCTNLLTYPLVNNAQHVLDVAETVIEYAVCDAKLQQNFAYIDSVCAIGHCHSFGHCNNSIGHFIYDQSVL